MGGTIVMHTSEGDVRVNLRDDISPTVANYFKSFAVEGKCGEANAGCTFYRSEAVPKPGAVDNYGGPGPPVGGPRQNVNLSHHPHPADGSA